MNVKGVTIVISPFSHASKEQSTTLVSKTKGLTKGCVQYTKPQDNYGNNNPQQGQLTIEFLYNGLFIPEPTTLEKQHSLESGQI